VKNLLKGYLFLFLVSGTLIAVDQYTKFLVRSNLEIGEMWSPWEWLTPYARIVHWWNTGVAFGMFQGMNQVFIVLAILVSLAIIYYFPRVSANEPIIRLAMAMQLGGAVGNLIDRIFVGHVTDFVSVGNFAVFNVADASISVGVAVLILGVWLQEERQKKAIASRTSEPNDPETALEQDEDRHSNGRSLDELASSDHEASG
jgi:signal peptidase II